MDDRDIAVQVARIEERVIALQNSLDGLEESIRSLGEHVNHEQDAIRKRMDRLETWMGWITVTVGLQVVGIISAFVIGNGR